MAMTRISAAEARNLLAKPKRSKYRAVRTVGAGGRIYASKLEAKHSEALDAQKRVGLIKGWLPQVSFALPGTTRRIVVDFVVVNLNGTIRLEDTKGIETAAWKMKREMLEQALGLPVDLIRRSR